MNRIAKGDRNAFTKDRCTTYYIPYTNFENNRWDRWFRQADLCILYNNDVSCNFYFLAVAFPHNPMIYGTYDAIAISNMADKLDFILLPLLQLGCEYLTYFNVSLYLLALKQ